MHKMATKKTKLFDIEEMQKTAGHNVSQYLNILGEVVELTQRNPLIAQEYLLMQVLARYKVSPQWFSEIQEVHKQHINDGIKGPK
jgi:hypothetical protein